MNRQDACSRLVRDGFEDRAYGAAERRGIGQVGEILQSIEPVARFPAGQVRLGKLKKPHEPVAIHPSRKISRDSGYLHLHLEDIKTVWKIHKVLIWYNKFRGGAGRRTGDLDDEAISRR